MEEWKEYKLADVCSRLRSGKGMPGRYIGIHRLEDEIKKQLGSIGFEI